MHLKEKSVVFFILFATLFCVCGVSFAEANPDRARYFADAKLSDVDDGQEIGCGRDLDLYTYEIVGALPEGSFMENITTDARGNLYITNLLERQILKYANGQLTVFAELDAYPAAIAQNSDGTFFVTAFQVPLDDPEFANSQAIYAIDRNGNSQLVLEVPQAEFFNGIFAFKQDILLIADSQAGTIWKYDAQKNQITAWLVDELLQSNGYAPGANGLKVYGDELYISNSGQGTILRTRLDQFGEPGLLEIFVENIQIDDFAFSRNGNIFATTHDRSIHRIDPTGNVETILDNDDILGNTALAFGRRGGDADHVYIVGDGGLWAAQGDESLLQPANIVKLYVGEKGYDQRKGYWDKRDGTLETLEVDFNAGGYDPLQLSFGPTDDPTTSDPAYTVSVIDGQAHYLAPQREPGIAFTGMFDLPEDWVPIENEMTHQWTFPQADQLLGLGGSSPLAWAIAGCYIRGDMYHWAGGLFGDYWFGFFQDASGAYSVIRQGEMNLSSEPFTAQVSVSYRIEKVDGTTLRLQANYDRNGWHQVGEDVTIALNEEGSDAVAITHLRIGDTSGNPIDVVADDFIWTQKR